MKNTFLSLFAVIGLLSFQNQASAHCQIPCGIYNDEAVFSILMTDIDTIEKAMNEIAKLSENPQQNANQLGRWITNKETHAQQIQNTVSAYFLAQRIKLDEKASNAEKYAKKLASLHEITVFAMKCKQTKSLENVTKLRAAVSSFKTLYIAK